MSDLKNMYRTIVADGFPDTMTIKEVRLISDEGGAIQDYDTAINAHDTVPGFTFMGNVQEGNTNTISLKRSYAKEYSIRLSFDPEKGTIPASDNYYVFVTVKHKTTEDTYFLKKLEISTPVISKGQIRPCRNKAGPQVIAEKTSDEIPRGSSSRPGVKGKFHKDVDSHFFKNLPFLLFCCQHLGRAVPEEDLRIGVKGEHCRQQPPVLLIQKFLQQPAMSQVNAVKLAD